jgi:hypothetical protein
MSRIFISVSLVSAALILGSVCDSARARGAYNGCVYPKTKPGHSHNIALLHRVFIYQQPSPTAKMLSELKLLIAFNIEAEKGEFWQVAGSTSSEPNFKEGQIVGWVMKADFDQVPPRNCN